MEAQRKAKEEADKAAQKAQHEADKQRKAAEAKAAKAPDKDKLTGFVQAFSIPGTPPLASQEATDIHANICARFDAFKKWAMQQIEEGL
jgi:membrane protein involved in colicin uptake